MRLSLSAAFALVVVCSLDAQPQGIAPPRDGMEVPTHVQQAHDDMERSRHISGIAAGLQAIKLEHLDRLARGVAPASVTVNQSVPVLLGNYSDVSHLFTAADYDDLLFDTAPGAKSMTNYFMEVSAGQYNLTGAAYGPFTAAGTQSYYENGDNGFGTDYPTNSAGFVRSVVAASDATVDYSQFDNDGPDGVPNSGDDDGLADAVIVYFPDGDAAGGDMDNLWGMAWYLQYAAGSRFATNDARIGGGFIEVDQFVISGGEQGSGSANVIKPIGAVCWDWGIVLGLPTLFDRDGSSYGVGTWCLMGNGAWGAEHSVATEDTPTHMSAWCRANLGWVIPTIVTALDTVGLLPGDVYKLWEDAYQGGRYFLVEYRDTTGFDMDLPSEGYLVWHCNEDVIYNNRYDSRRMIDLEEADGLNEIDSRASYMDQGDMYPWGGTSFHNASNPNSRDVDGDSTGVQVNGFAMGPGKTIWIEMIPRQIEGYTISYTAQGPLWGWGYSTLETNYGAVVFDATAPGRLVAVQAGAFDDYPFPNAIPYVVRIFDDMNEFGPVDLRSTDSGSFPIYLINSYHEISLAAPLCLTSQQTFLVDVAWGPDDYAVPTIMRRPHSGRSYFSSTGEYYLSYDLWTDKDVALRARVKFNSQACPVVATGDVNSDATHTSADIIYMVAYVFKSGTEPVPCPAAADVNCDRSVTSADVIYMVNYVFKGADSPCNVCCLVEDGAWTCP